MRRRSDPFDACKIFLSTGATISRSYRQKKKLRSGQERVKTENSPERRTV